MLIIYICNELPKYGEDDEFFRNIISFVYNNNNMTYSMYACCTVYLINRIINIIIVPICNLYQYGWARIGADDIFWQSNGQTSYDVK